MDERTTKRDLVLAPSEYAYMQDVTKGIIKIYTGPTVINPTAQERPVVFADGEFAACALEDAVQPIALAPEGHYLILKNPWQKNDHPPSGGVYPAPELDVGRKINITGPCAFALWPGQIVQLVHGHRLRSDQYLVTRVFNDGTTPVNRLQIITGTDLAFYIPPTGTAVVPDEHGNWVRDALTLERLEYCILVDQNGKKRYERGPQVVFPAPTETFVGGQIRKFRAIELNEIQGLHVKVVAPYLVDGKTVNEGAELFITGKETAIYFPREEHQLVRVDGHDRHFAVAVPAGEARYVMNRKTGDIRTVRGPAMLLPNPVEEVIVRRALSDRECATWYPHNAAVLAHNRALRIPADKPAAQQKPTAQPPASFESVDRSSTFTKPRTLVFDTKLDGAPAVSVWVGYAVLVVDKQGRRRVEQGPKNLLLEYDETLEVIQLSTGTPKSTDDLVETAYLRVLNNKVSDTCVVHTSDHVAVTLSYALRVSFEGEPARWFEVENYVKLLCDHVRSVLKGTAKQHAIEAFHARSTELVRAAILGTAEPRAGMMFAENGMRVTDVEVLDAAIDDEGVAALIGDAQQEAITASIETLRATRRAAMSRHMNELAIAETADVLRVALARLQAELDQAELQRQTALARNAVADADHAAELARRRTAAELDHQTATADQALVLAALRAEVDAAVQRFGAAQGGFSEALLALSNQDVLAKVAEAMSVQAFVGGKTLTDVIDKVFAGTPLAGVMDRVKARVVPVNGNNLGEARKLPQS
jgi:major vault protein